MPSPTKKRKLNNGAKTAAAPNRLEFFFNKQKQNETPTSASSENESAIDGDPGITDEELARRLQAEFDREVASEPSNSNRDDRESAVEDRQRAGQESEDASSKKQNSGESSQSRMENVEASEPFTAKPSLPPPDNSKKVLTLQSSGIAEDAVTSNIPFNESPLTFDPSKHVEELQKHRASDAGNASYALLTRCFVLVSATSSRIKIVDTLVNCLRVLIESDPSSLLPAVSIRVFVATATY